MTYFGAKQKCDSMNSKLPEPIDLAEVKAIHEAINMNSIWIGINYIQGNVQVFNLYRYLDTDNHDFSWRYASDDTNVTYFNWAFGEPTGENCVTMGGTGEEFWKDDTCFKEFKFTCEILSSQGPYCDTCKNGFFGALSSCQGKFKRFYQKQDCK